jgi:hypothetical protein
VRALLLVALSIGCGAPASSPEPTPVVEGAPATPRHAHAVREGTTVELGSEPGPLVDGNSPPPLPGSTPYVHAALHGRCDGDPMGCSQAGDVVRAARSFDEAITGLRAIGFEVTVAPE